MSGFPIILTIHWHNKANAAKELNDIEINDKKLLVLPVKGQLKQTLLHY